MGTSTAIGSTLRNFRVTLDGGVATVLVDVPARR